MDFKSDKYQILPYIIRTNGNGFVVRLYQYPDGAIVPSDNACELCQCYSGDVICPVQECPPAPAGCTALPVPEGKCCPDYSCPVAQTNEDRDPRWWQ